MDNLFAWFRLTDSTLYVEGLRDSLALDGVYLNTGVTFTVQSIKDAKGEIITGQSFPVAGAYVVGTEGMWAATIAYPSAFVLGKKYRAELRAVAGGKTRTWYVEFEVRDDVRR